MRKENSKGSYEEKLKKEVEPKDIQKLVKIVSAKAAGDNIPFFYENDVVLQPVISEIESLSLRLWGIHGTLWRDRSKGADLTIDEAQRIVISRKFAGPDVQNIEVYYQ